MNCWRIIRGYLTPVVTLALPVILMLVPEAAAAEAEAGFRPTWDLVLRWVNFLILVAVIVKFARRPLKDFIDGKRDEVAFELRRMEEQKEAALASVKEVYRQLESSQERFEEIKARILRQSRARKEEIIEQARNESQVILDSTRRKIDFKLLEARKKLRAELVDSAVDMALEKLPQHVTAEDNHKILEQYINRIS